MNVNNLKIFTVLVVRKREIARIQTEKYRLCCEEGLSLNPVSAAAATYAWLSYLTSVSLTFLTSLLVEQRDRKDSGGFKLNEIMSGEYTILP